MKLIVGLGNIGKKYNGTRHNIGFEVIDQYAASLNIILNKDKFNGLFYKHNNFIIAKPTTYMNLSGSFVFALANFFKIKLEDILVIYDDIDLKIGQVMMKPKGGHAGHNGMKDIQNKFNTKEVPRIKIGIGRGKNITSYVLGSFSNGDKIVFNKLMKDIFEAINLFINDESDKAMLKLNTR